MNRQMKKMGKDVLVKFILFLFCVCYMYVHNICFGADNSVVGVVFLIAFLMFSQNDMGYNTKQATGVIFILFLIVAVAPKISLINPYIGFFVNLISIFFILVLSSHNITMGNHVAFLMGYLMCQGYDVSGMSYLKRVMSLVISGILVMSFYYFKNRKKEYKRALKDIFREIDINSSRTQWYLKLSITISVVTLIGSLINYPRIMWINLVILSLITPLLMEHKSRRMDRIPATILGSILFYMLFECVVPSRYHGIMILAAGFLSMFITNYFLKTIYNSFSALIAAVLLFPTKDAVFLRIISNIIGVVIAIVASFIFHYLFLICKKCRSNMNGEYH